jgi:hypothetical protein
VFQPDNEAFATPKLNVAAIDHALGFQNIGF